MTPCAWILDSGGAGRGAWQGGVLYEMMRWARQHGVYPTITMGASSVSNRQEPWRVSTRNGLDSDSSVEIHIQAFPVDHVSVLSRCLYSTFADIHYSGEFHAISLYFGQDHLEAILSRGPLRLRLFVKFKLDQDPATPRTIDFPETVYCDVCARIGEEEQGKYESFIPFTVQSISDSLGPYPDP